MTQSHEHGNIGISLVTNMNENEVQEQLFAFSNIQGHYTDINLGALLRLLPQDINPSEYFLRFSSRSLGNAILNSSENTTVIKPERIIDDSPITRFAAGRIAVNASEYTVEVDGRGIELALKEFEIVDAFAKSAGSLLTRRMIGELVWGYDAGRTIDVHVGKIRAKLGRIDNKLADITTGAIETVRQLGYRGAA